MSKTITINNGGRYDDMSYTDERHYHYEGGKEEKEKAEEGEKDNNAGSLRVRLRLVEALLEQCGITTANTDRSKLCRLMAFTTGSTEGYVKKIYTERHVDLSPSSCKNDLEKLRELMSEAGLHLNI